MVVTLAVTAFAALVGAALPQLGLPTIGDMVSRGTVVAAALMAASALSARGVHQPPRNRPGFLLLAMAALWVGFSAVRPALGLPGHLGGMTLDSVLLAVTILGGLLLLPRPDGIRRDVERTLLDALGASLAFAVLVSESVPVTPGPQLGEALLDVALVGVAVGVVTQARRPGGLAIVPLVLLAVGAAMLAVADLYARQGGAEGVVAAMTAMMLLSWTAAGAAVPSEVEDDGDLPLESHTAMVWRERVAVVVPLLTLAAAVAVLGGAAVVGVALSARTLVISGALVATLMTTVVLSRLDSLRTERRIDELVLSRTLSIGEREKWFRALVRNSSDVVTVVDVRGLIRFQTPSVTRILGHDPEKLVGSRFTSILRPTDGRRFDATLADAARTPGRALTLDLSIWAADGSWCETETTVMSLLHDPDIRGIVLNTRDVSERRRLEQALTEQAFSDSLTGLANRTLFRTRVETALKVALAPGEVAVIFLDLDGFKAVNDAHGHHVGDELLTLVARRVSGSLRPGDLVARLGGDEFAVLVTGPGADASARWAAERIVRALAAPFVLEGRSVTLGASLGIAVADTGDETADQLLRNADLAMYRSKDDRTQTYVRFEAHMHDALVARVNAEAELRRAIQNNDLVLYYQPVVDLQSGLIVGVEALVRWRHPETGVVPPGEFIGLAEETGLVADIGRWALQESTAQGARWQRFALPGRHLKMAVNVSAQQFEPGLPRLVHDLLAATGLPGPALTLEMTESVLMERPDEVVQLLKRIKGMGVRVAVDDFGTGYSSLSYLARFPVDQLKIDQSFVRRLGEADGQGELVRTIVKLGETLRLDTVAEGIETPAQHSALQDMGCVFGQGYLFARPLPADEVDRLLQAQANELAGGRVSA